MKELLADTQIEDSLSGIRVVKSFANEKEEMKKFRRGNDRFVAAKRKTYRYMGVYNSGMGAFSTLITVCSLIMGAYLMTTGELTSADLVTFLLYISNFTEPVKKLVNFTILFRAFIRSECTFLYFLASRAILVA